MEDKIRVLLTEEEVNEKIKKIGEQISKDYAGKSVHMICVLKGGVFFTCELAKRITVPVSLDFMSVSSYGSETKSSGIVKIIKDDYDADCYIAISSDIGDLSEVADKMEELEVLMENKFYHPEIHVFYPNMEGETPGIIQFDDDTFMKQMKQDIKMKDVEALREHFQRFCEKYRHKTEYSQIYIKFLFSNLMKDIYGSIDETDEAELNKDIEKLYMATDFQVLTELVEEAIRRLETCFAGKTQTAHREVELVKQYIYRNYGSELGIDMLADMVHLAPSYLSTVFKKETGQNLSKFIKAYRMEQAKDMLENSMTKIVDISVACGYPNVSYFCSSFREFFGVSPQKFRESGGQADA